MFSRGISVVVVYLVWEFVVVVVVVVLVCCTGLLYWFVVLVGRLSQPTPPGQRSA